MPHIIQFTHPGREHGPDRATEFHKSWNTGGHARKFMQCAGDYVSGHNRLNRDKLLLFWGEWEPPSDVLPLGKPSDPRHPRWLHEPYLPQHISSIAPPSCASQNTACKHECGNGKVLQNTDPFVFEGAFKYFTCKQGMANGTQLERGSMILFGSTSGTDRTKAFFQLDTVFVVADWIEYDPSDLSPLRAHPEVSRMYDHVVISKVAPSAARHSVKLKLRLYRGATFHNPVSGMYSFSPARVCAASPVGFPRVRLASKYFLTNNLNSAPKSTPGSSDEIQKAWMDVRAESRAQGCVEGVRFTVRKESDRTRNLRS